MRLEWDEAKNRANVRKHGFDFTEAEELFRGPLLIRPDTDQDYGEERWLGVGMTRGSRCICGICREVARHNPHHLTEKGRS